MSDIIKTAERTEKRKFNKVFNNDLRKYLAEIITNSDDSYKRLEADGAIEESSICPIYVTVDKSKREVVVVDNAEGMDLDDLKKNFVEYGADTSGGSTGHKVRGLFGQGASDVLLNTSLNNKVAEIDSIKNDRFYTCKFKWGNNEKRIHRQQSKMSKSNIKDLRQHYEIPNNGTIVRFGLPDAVGIPRKLEEEISSFYMLRFILNKQNRNVVLISKTGKKIEETLLKYDFPPRNEESVLVDSPVSFVFEGQTITGKLTIEKKSSNSSEYGDLKILSFGDELSVYDNSLFGYEKYPNADSIHGYLQLKGASEIIRAKLNQKIPEEILTDTRDGFVRNHEFYKSLTKVVEPHILGVLQIINSENKEKEVSLAKQKEWNDAFKEINKYFRDELEEDIGGADKGTDPPSEGIRFVYPSIKVTAGRKYALKLLINTNLVPINSKVVINYDDQNLEVSPIEFKVSANDVVQGNLATKSVSIAGIIPSDKQNVVLASTLDKFNAKLFVSVIDQEIHYPKYGLEFWPNSVVSKVNSESKGHLFFDTTRHPPGSTVRFTSSSSSVDLLDSSVVLSKQHLITETVGVVECKFIGRVIDSRSRIVAAVGNATSELVVTIKEHSQPPAGSSGFLSGVTIRNSDNFWQTFYNPRDGQININSGNNVNKLHLGDVDPENPKFSKDQNKYLAELCATESAKQMVRRKIEKGKILETDFESVLDAIQKEKNKLLEIFVRSIEKLIQ